MRPRDGDALANAPLDRQAGALADIVRSNPVARTVLELLPPLGVPSWYLGAGAITQTVWNHLHGFDPANGIADYDVVYFDADDLSAESERAVEARLRALLADPAVRVDVTNEARVHLWYEQRFGRPLAAYRSVEHAIATWPTTATSVGLRLDGPTPTVCAPFGLADLFAMVVRPNTALVDVAVYERKAQRWRALWPRLTVLPWPSAV